MCSGLLNTYSDATWLIHISEVSSHAERKKKVPVNNHSPWKFSFFPYVHISFAYQNQDKNKKKTEKHPWELCVYYASLHPPKRRRSCPRKITVEES
jgi:hypothetical protein